MLPGLFPPIWTAGAEAATPKAVSKCLHFGTAPDCELACGKEARSQQWEHLGIQAAGP